MSNRQKILFLMCAVLVHGMAVTTWALKVDFNKHAYSPSPSVWTGWRGNLGDFTSRTIAGVTITFTNESTGGHGCFHWFGDYTASGSDGLEDMVEDGVGLHGDDSGTDWQSGDILALGLRFSGLMINTQYEITTWHNHNWSTPTLDISVGGEVVVDGLAHTHQVSNSDSAASATFTFITDASGVSPDILFASETVLGDPKGGGGNAHLQLEPNINGFELTELGSDWMNKATEPNPENGSSGHIASELTELSWTPGLIAVGHAVYFGESFEAVDSATDPNGPVGLGFQEPNSIPVTVGYGTAYFWRVDEYNSNGTWTKGTVWSFETASASSWVELLKVDFNNELGAPSPTGWTGWFGWPDTSTTIDGITITLINRTTGGHGGLAWVGSYTASGRDGLEDMVEDAVSIHGSDNEWDPNGFKSGDILAIGMTLSGLMINTGYEITTWHNHMWSMPRLDISVGGTVVVNSLAHTRKAANSNSAANATFNFITDDAGVSPEILFTSETVLGDPKGGGGNAHLQIVPHINGFELKTEDAPVFGFNQSSSSGFEDDEGPVLLEVALANQEPGRTYIVDYAVVGGTADGDDYTLPQPQTLTFNPGDGIKTISIDINNDGIDEEDETLILELSNPTGGAKVGYPNHTYTIIDIRPKISFAVASGSGIENVTPVLIEVTLNKDDYGDTVRDTITVDYAATGGTAVNGDKYILPPGTLTFPPGVVTQYITMDVVDDDIKIQPDETVVLTLSNPGGPSVLAGITEYTYTFIEDDEGIQWEGKTWYFTNEGKDNYRRLFINDDGDLEWWPQQKGQIVVRIPEQRLSQAGDVAELSYLWMSDGPHGCSGCSCDCFEQSIACVAGTGDFRVVLAEADGEYQEHDGGNVGNDIFVGYKAVQFRFGPNMNSSPTRWVDCHGEVHKTGTINKKPENSENLAHGNDDTPYRVLPGFELTPGKYSLFTLKLQRTGGNINASITLNGRTYDADISGGDQPQKVDVFAIYMRNGRPYTRVVLSSLKECPGDINRDFKVNEADLEELAADWLKQGYSEAKGTEPDENGLILHYDFDGTLSNNITSVNDSVSGFNLTTFEDSQLRPQDNVSLVYGQPNPWSDTGTSARFNNLNADGPADNDPGAGLFAPDPGANSAIDLSTLGAFTVEAFIKPRTLRQSVIIRKYGGGMWYLDLRSDGQVAFAINGDNNAIFTGAGSIVTDTWYHVAGVFDETDAAAPMKIYLDGVLADTGTYNQHPLDSARGLGVGSILRDNNSPPADSAQFYDGIIDEVKLYNYALSQDEVIYEANNGSAMIYTPPDSRANLYDDNIVDFMDFAVLASQWLETCE